MTWCKLSCALLYVLVHFSTNICGYRFMSKYEYQLGLVDIITEAAPEDPFTDECFQGGKDHLSHLTREQKYRMCREALTLDMFRTNNFTIIENGVPGEVKKYKASFQISHVPGDDLMHLVSLGFSCPVTPGPLYLQQGTTHEVIYANSLVTAATTPAFEVM